MVTKELEEKLKLEYNAELINEIDYDNKKYIRAVKVSSNCINYIFFELYANNLKEVTDTKLLKVFNNLYESENKDIIY
jgi:hypothetical protein